MPAGFGMIFNYLNTWIGVKSSGVMEQSSKMLFKTTYFEFKFQMSKKTDSFAYTKWGSRTLQYTK